MIKSVIKEIFIILLLSTAILLILGILFYDYIPINRVVPEKEAYITPDEVKEEIDETITEADKKEITYEITDSDLNIYKQSGHYIEGKENPFELDNDNSVTTDNNTSGNSSNNSQSNNNQNQSSNDQTNTKENSTSTFFNDEGIK